MKKTITIAFLLLLSSILWAENWYEIGFKPFSKPGNDVTSYDITHWTDEVEFDATLFDSLCVVAHSEKINSNTAALIFSRWFFKNNFSGHNCENYVLQDTLLLESGTIIDHVKFPISRYREYKTDTGYEFEYLYFSRTKNNQKDLCRIKHLGSNNFTPPETIVANIQGNGSYSVNKDIFLYCTNQKIVLKDFVSGLTISTDSINCQNPQILNPSNYISWEKVFGDTVKTYYAQYDVSSHTLGEIKQFHTGDVRNLHISTNHSIWESVTDSKRQTFYTNYSQFSTGNVYETKGNIYNLQTVEWYGEFSTHQANSNDVSNVFFRWFDPNNSSVAIDSITNAKDPLLQVVGFKCVMGYAPWFYLKNIDGKYQLQAKMLYLPECGIEPNSNNPQNSILVENYPNPFNNSTRINFLLPQSGMTTVSVYNSNGQFVKNLKSEILSSGLHNLEFKADELNSGLFFVKISTSGMQKVHKILLTK